jgi:hypothetical protein
MTRATCPVHGTPLVETTHAFGEVCLKCRNGGERA